MTSEYRQRPSDFHPHGLPTLQPGTMDLLFAEQFDALGNKDPANPYLGAMLWPDGWVDYNTAGILSSYCDAGMHCGIVNVANPDHAGGYLLAGKVREMPGYGNAAILAWKVFARIGLGPRWYGALKTGCNMIGGLIVSPAALGPAADGASKMNGLNNGQTNTFSAWTNKTTLADEEGTNLITSSVYVQWDITYNAISNTTTIIPSGSEDGIGFMGLSPEALPAFDQAVQTFTGRPRSIGFAVTQSVTVDEDDPDWDAEGSMRIDYLAVFGSATQPASASEGARTY